MARRLRIEFPGALYHLINRGNTRRAIFHGESEARAFLKVLEQTVVRSGWRLHGRVLMSNLRQSGYGAVAAQPAPPPFTKLGLRRPLFHDPIPSAHTNLLESNEAGV